VEHDGCIADRGDAHSQIEIEHASGRLLELPLMVAKLALASQLNQLAGLAEEDINSSGALFPVWTRLGV
jgi:hypothetical protein